MKILVWGLGYVGTVTGAFLAKLGHEVVGVEPNVAKVNSLNSGSIPIKEPGLEDLVKQVVGSRHFRATGDGISLVPWADISLICVGTPSCADGSPRLDYLRNAAMEIGKGLKGSGNYHVIAVRSTVFPGTTRDFLSPIVEEYSNCKRGDDFGLVMNPEFLRETKAITDFQFPPHTIIGELDSRSGDVVEALYREIDAPIRRVSLEVAEILKMINNAFHALKVGFANEVGRLSDRIGIDSHSIMDMVCSDTKLNISPTYLKPGFAFGGSCLPKDLRSVSFNSKRLGVKLPILDAVLPSNEIQIEDALVKVQQAASKCVGVLGLSFKPETDDLRDSPIISLIRGLWQDGVDVLVYDPDVVIDEMIGSNKEYLERQLPQINQILCKGVEEVINKCQTIVVSQKREEFVLALQDIGEHTTVIDLVRLKDDFGSLGISKYKGISW